MADIIRMILFFAAPIMIGSVVIGRTEFSDAESILLGAGAGILMMALFETYININTIAKKLTQNE